MSAATALFALVVGYFLIKLFPASKWAFKLTILALMLGAVAFTGGWIGRTLSSIATAGTSTTSTVTQSAVGVAVPGVLGVAAALIVGRALWPKHTVTRSSGKGVTSGTVALVAAVMLPFWMTSIGGPAGGLVRCGVTQLNAGTNGVVGASFGTGTLTGIAGPCGKTGQPSTPQQPAPAPAPGNAGTQAEGGNR